MDHDTQRFKIFNMAELTKTICVEMPVWMHVYIVMMLSKEVVSNGYKLYKALRYG